VAKIVKSEPLAAHLEQTKVNVLSLLSQPLPGKYRAEKRHARSDGSGGLRLLGVEVPAFLSRFNEEGRWRM
jgi:hypothetical protein